MKVKLAKSEITLFIIIFVTILSILLVNPVNNLDELWNYNFAKNCADGLIPYKEFNMVQMPLLPIACGIILKIIGNELVVMRILAALLCSAIIYTTYNLFKILNIKKDVSIVFICIIGVLFIEFFCIDYNFATLFLVLLIILKEIKYYKEDIELKENCKRDIFLGVLAGLTITLKQTTGVFVCIALLGNKLLLVKTKKELKVYLKVFCYRLVGVMIPVVLIILYVILNGAWTEFINYAILGITQFSNYISYKNLIKLNFVGILSILVPITFAYMGIKSIILKKDRILQIFLAYGLAMFVMCFPISDKIHFLIGALPSIIAIMYEIYQWCREKFSDKLKFNVNIFANTFLKPTILLSLSCIIISNYYQYLTCYHSKLHHFKFVPINENLENRIEIVNKYIKSNDNVKILDATAAIYTIPIDIYNKDYDLLLKGNLGFDGENRLIEEISNSKDTRYLVLKDEFYKNWQTPLTIIEYVKNNKTKVEEIELFDVYK